MRSILLSLHSNWIYKLASKQKTIEVRKVKPKLKTPFKCYIYCTNNCDRLYSVNGVIQPLKKIVVDLTQPSVIRELNGYVVGEFICDAIGEIDYINGHYCINQIDAAVPYRIDPFYLRNIGLTEHELEVYGVMGLLYGWHISDLVIYPEPKQLSDFVQGCNRIYCHEGCEYVNSDNFRCTRKVTRPPQSFIYVEELHENT